MGAHVNSARALVIASRSKSWHICRCQGCLVDIEPSRVLQRRFEARALGSFLGVWRGGGSISQVRGRRGRHHKRCSLENGNKWVMEAGFHGLIRGGSQRISAK